MTLQPSVSGIRPVTSGLIPDTEGIEKEDQFDALQGIGWACGQGYLFSRPVPAPQCEALLSASCELPYVADQRKFSVVRSGTTSLPVRRWQRRTINLQEHETL